MAIPIPNYEPAYWKNTTLINSLCSTIELMKSELVEQNNYISNLIEQCVYGCSHVSTSIQKVSPDSNNLTHGVQPNRRTLLLLFSWTR